MADTTLVIGDLTFGSLEIPAQISVGGAQRTAVHELVGGTRIIDAMGRSDRDLEWSGMLLGATAVTRALYLDGLRQGGNSHTVAWDQYSYTVVVKEFQADYQRSYQIPYRIVCQVVQDNTSAVTSPGDTPLDTAINTDFLDAQTLAAVVADTTLNTLIANLELALLAVSSFVNAPPSTAATVLNALAPVSSRVASLIGTVGAVVGATSGFGGLIAGVAPSAAATVLSGQVTASVALSALYNMRGLCGRMSANLGAVAASSVTMAVAGGNLFQIASEQYGDPTAWTGIAKANSLSDPFITGPDTLTIPPQADTTDGVLSF